MGRTVYSFRGNIWKTLWLVFPSRMRVRRVTTSFYCFRLSLRSPGLWTDTHYIETHPSRLTSPLFSAPPLTKLKVGIKVTFKEKRSIEHTECPCQTSPVSDHQCQKTIAVKGILFAASWRKSKNLSSETSNSRYSLINFNMWPTCDTQ